MKIANLGGIMEKLNLTFLMESLTRTSVQAGVLVMVVLAVQWLLRKQLSPRWRCALWLLVVTRLLLPVSISSTASIFNLMPFWTDRAHNAFEPMTRVLGCESRTRVRPVWPKCGSERTVHAPTAACSIINSILG